MIKRLLKNRKMKSNFLNQIDEIRNHESKLILESVIIDGIEHKTTIFDVVGEATITYSKEK